MKVMKTEPVPATTATVLDYIKCELCDQTSPREDWAPRQYEVNEPEVSLSVGRNYPEGGYHTRTVLDICPKCFKEKLIPWFLSQGGKLREVECDW